MNRIPITLTALVAVIMAGCEGAPIAPPKTQTSETHEAEGTWEVVALAAEVNGVAWEDDGSGDWLLQSRMEIDAGIFTWRTDDQVVLYAGTYFIPDGSSTVVIAIGFRGEGNPPIDYTAHLRYELNGPDRGTFLWTSSDKLNEKFVVTVERVAD